MITKKTNKQSKKSETSFINELEQYNSNELFLTLKMVYFQQYLALLFVLALFSSIQTQNDSYFSPNPENDASSTNQTNSCLTSCEDCGPNADKCIFNFFNCTFKCECKKEFSGELCDTIIDSELNVSFRELKLKAWSDLISELTGSRISLAMYAKIFERLKNLCEDIASQNGFDTYDVYQMNLLISRLLELNERLVYPNDEKTIEILFESVNQLIRTDSSKKILASANLEFTNSALKIFEKIDRLIKHFTLHSSSIYLKLSSLEVLFMERSPSDTTHLRHKFELKLSSDKSIDSYFVDSISLNEKVLREIFGNRKIKVAFKIYYSHNDKYGPIDEEAIFRTEREFYEQLREMQKNFFYEITTNTMAEHNNATTTMPKVAPEFSFTYFVSSNVLSAVVYDESKAKSTNLEISHHEKLVRIQFVIDLKRFGNRFNNLHAKLLCVFWNRTKLEWSTQGCVSSQLESMPISATSYYQKVCYCNHLTNFALLFDPDAGQYLTVVEHSPYQSFLTLLTYVGISISCLCYLVLILSRLFYRGKKDAAHSSQDNALKMLYLFNALCLLVSNLLFLVVLEVKPTFYNLNQCLLAGSLMHFFLLASFCFSFATAWHHYVKLVRIFHGGKIVLLKWTLFSVLFSFLFAASGFYLQRSEHPMDLSTNCWLRKPYIYYLFVAPISVLLSLSFIFYIFVTIRVLSIYNYFFSFKCCCFVGKKSNARGVEDETVSSGNSSYNNRRVIVLLSFSFISLGLTWLIGFFIIIASHINFNLKIVMEFLFCLTNSFHGLCLLVGSFLAKKYSKPASAVSSGSFTKTTFNKTNSSSVVSRQSKKSRRDTKTSELSLTLSARFYLCVYGTGYWASRLFNCKKNATTRNGNNEIGNINKMSFLEFSIIDYQDDANKMSLRQTTNTQESDKNISDILKFKDLEKDIFTSSV